MAVEKVCATAARGVAIEEEKADRTVAEDGDGARSETIVDDDDENEGANECRREMGALLHAFASAAGPGNTLLPLR